MSLVRRVHVAELCAVLGLVPHSLAQGTTVRVSVATNGAQANGYSEWPSISPDGRYVAFTSFASNLVAGDTNGVSDAFLRDLVLQTTTRISRSTAGTQGNGPSGGARFSRDGRTVYFASDATNLVSGDTNASTDGFAYDLATGATTRVTVTSTGGQPAGSSYVEDSSEDGRWIVFSSVAFNIVSGDTNNNSDVYVRSLQSGLVLRASVTTAGAQSNGFSHGAAISGDGRFAAFCAAGMFDFTDTNPSPDAYVHDFATGTTECVSVDYFGATAAGTYDAPVAISRDGRYVAFESSESTIVTGDNNGAGDLFVRDRQLATTFRCSPGAGSLDPNSSTYEFAMARESLLLVFTGEASNLIPSDGNGAWDVFLYDRDHDVTRLVSAGLAGVAGNQTSREPSLSATAHDIAFASNASNLVSGDTNALQDIFVRREAPPRPQTYCTAGTTSSGCVPSISAAAQPSVSLATPCSIAVSNVEGQRTGLIFYGVDNSSFTPLAWGTSSSFLCIKSPTQRTPAQSSGGSFGGCDGALLIDWNAFQAANPSALGQPWSAGTSAYVQGWFRDPPSPKHTMLSNALELVYVP